MVRLAGFYDACLREEGLRDLRFRVEDEVEAFVSTSLDGASLLAGDQQALVDDRITNWFASRRVGFSGARFYVGFPVTSLRDGAEVSPLLYAPVDVESSDGLFITLADPPQVNYRVLEDAGYSTDEAVEAAAVIESSLRDAAEGTVASQAEDAITELSELVGITTDDLDLSALDGLAGRSGGSGVLLNSAILFASDRLGYTQSTRRELQRLAEDPALWRGTALAALLAGDPTADGAAAGDLLTVSPLSEAQRAAVVSALSNQLTVVTGPPGTGKSELVLNLVANGLIRGETVLVASRNNKAVDVVVERFRGLTDEATMVRVGRSSFRGQAIALMRKVVAGVRPPAASEVARAQVDLDAVRRDRADLINAARDRTAADSRCSRSEQQWEEAARSLAAAEVGVAREEAVEPGPVSLDEVVALRTWLEARAAGRRSIIERLASMIKPERPIKSTRSVVALWRAKSPRLFRAEVESASWADLVAIAQHAEYIKRAALAWRQLQDDSMFAAMQRSPQSLSDAVEAVTAREANAGRRYLAVERQRVLADLPHEEQQKLAEYLRAVDQLSGSERLGGRMYAQLKALESRLFADVQRVFPVWAITTLTARSNLPQEPGLFDLLIVDEASQCDLPSAFPLLARAKRAVVIGDDKQLIHVTPLRPEAEQALAVEHGLGAEELVNYSYRDVSLFTRARHIVTDRSAMTLLDEHYRSHPLIIGFSNHRFYGGRLSVFTEPERLIVASGPGNSAVRWTDVAGVTVRPSTGSAYNDAEVDGVVRAVGDLIRDEGPTVSIGVVTPFRAQKERITRELARRFDTTTLESHKVIVDTAHGFQGDERDVIVFSTVISSGARPGTVGFVEGNPNLFNVAVTRARSLLVIVGDEGVCKSRDGLLGDLARYAVELRGPAHVAAVGACETDEEELLFEALIAAGHQPAAQYEARGWRIDIAIPDRVPPIAIEVDGSSHDAPDGTRLLRDVYRDLKLRRAGWRVERVPAWRVRLDPGAVAAQITAEAASDGVDDE